MMKNTKTVCALFFLLKHFMEVFWFFWKVGGKEDDGNNEETKRVEQVILRLMRK